MNDLIHNSTGNLITCIVEIVLGILLLIDPVGFTSAIIIIFGIVLAVVGVFSLVRYFKSDAHVAALENNLANGLMGIVFGLFCVFRSDWFISAFPVLTTLYGVLALVSGISKIQWAVDMFRMKQKYWFIGLISAILTIVFALIIINNPFSSTSFIWTFIGVSMIVEAVIDLLSFIFGRKK